MLLAEKQACERIE
jgi:hypothetical protein